jgi:hypothetical protein
MLLKNGEPYKLTAQDHKEIKEKYKKFPLRLVYPSSRVNKNRLQHNILPDKPNSITFPLMATLKTEKGTESWRYCERSIVAPNGTIRYSPPNLYFRGKMSLDITDIELIWWLVKICPHMENGENFNGKVPKCAIEDLVGEAEVKADREERLATMKALIYSSQVGLGEKRLRQVAKAFFIPDVDELSFAQVKLAVENYIQRDKLKGTKKFLDLIDAKQVLEVRENIQKAIDQDLIKFMIQNKTWAWVTDQGRKNEPIVQVASNSEPHEALYDYYMGDRKFAEELISALKGSKVVIPEPEES